MVYPIVKFGNPVLEREADDVRDFDTPELRQFLEDMFESMYAAKGVGLAAPQIGFSRKIAVIDVSNGEIPAEKLVLMNLRKAARIREKAMRRCYARSATATSTPRRRGRRSAKSARRTCVTSAATRGKKRTARRVKTRPARRQPRRAEPVRQSGG
jgi:hypothetical protein